MLEILGLAGMVAVDCHRRLGGCWERCESITRARQTGNCGDTYRSTCVQSRAIDAEERDIMVSSSAGTMGSGVGLETMIKNMSKSKVH